MIRPPPVSPEGCYRSGAWIADLSWPDVGPRLRAGAVVIVPMGAAAKARGAHLPVDTDRETAIGARDERNQLRIRPVLYREERNPCKARIRSKQ